MMTCGIIFIFYVGVLCACFLLILNIILKQAKRLNTKSKMGVYIFHDDLLVFNISLGNFYYLGERQNSSKYVGVMCA